ncbi:MAG TPA: YwdI family protein [Planococcus sp. (in: firmicutes)]|nr:YwdI family protein [Planococcus sp. (in: firmicutes)]
MAIETSRILTEIEKHTALAKQGDPAKMRESVAAIRALCDLLLSDDGGRREDFRAVPVAQPQPAQTLTTEAKPMKENGANGESLFDF